MHSLIDSRALLRFTWAGALALTVAACSRSDRADSGRDTSQTANIGSGESQSATTGDTAVASSPADPAGGTASASADTAAPASSAAPEKPSVSGYRAMGRDTAAVATGEVSGAATDGDSVISPGRIAADTAAAQSDSVVVGDSTNVGKPGERLEENQASEQTNADSLAGQTAEPVRPPEDSSETIGVTTDTAAAGAEMARDTSTVLAQGDTTAQQSEVTVDTADTTDAIEVNIDTATAEPPAEVAQETPADTAIVVGDSAEVGKTGERLEANTTTADANADSLAADAERVRPPEDSTEIHGNVTETADAQTGNAEVPAKDESIEADTDTASTAAAEVSSTGNIATGADAVALMTREGRRCVVTEGQQSQDAQWDLAGSPATMNPCGTGTMTLPRVQTEE